MDDLTVIRNKIISCKAKLKRAKDGEKSEAYLISLQNHLTALQKEENILLSYLINN